MSYPPHIWGQLKNITAQHLVRALKQDGWVQDESRGAVLVYLHPNGKRVTIHWHPNKTYQPKLLNELLNVIGWNVADFKRLKLIK